jgi:DHA1 family bicyclomycin/chloramphenicol resistance-like MFS transporter
MTHALSKRHVTVIVWTMLSLMFIIGMCIDLVAPSLPAIAHALSVSKALAKDVIAFYLLGFALGNFLMGFLTDAWGRQKLMRISLLLFVASSLLPIFFANIYLLLFARLMQGLTIGAVSVLLRAICADVLSPQELTNFGPLVGVVWGLGPVLGPVIGGYLQSYFGWQAGFYLFSLLSFVIFLVVIFILPETHYNRHPLKLARIRLNITEVLKHRVFIGISMLMGLTYSAMIAFSVAGPFLIQTTLGHTPIFFGHIAFCLGVVFLLSSIGARYVIAKTEITTLWRTGVCLGFIAAVVGFMMSFYAPMSIGVAIIFSALMFSVCGLQKRICLV